MLTAVFFLLQLDSADEQAAAIRRELDGRMQKVAEMEKVKTGRAQSCHFIYKIDFNFLTCI
jgi:hypothetical protein